MKFERLALRLANAVRELEQEAVDTPYLARGFVILPIKALDRAARLADRVSIELDEDDV